MPESEQDSESWHAPWQRTQAVLTLIMTACLVVLFGVLPFRDPRRDLAATVAMLFAATLAISILVHFTQRIIQYRRRKCRGA